LTLQRWSSRNAVWLMCALLAALALGRAWIVAAAALVSFSLLLLGARRAFTPGGSFGWANLVTSLRLGLVLLLLTAFHGAPRPLGALVVITSFALDGLDGWLARRTGQASAFGAHYDMEVDALLVLAVALELRQAGGYGVWILISGLWRYLYVLCVAWLPPRGGEAPRSRLGRSAFGILICCLAAGLAFPGSTGALCCGLGSVVVTLSFVRSFYFSYFAGASLSDRS